MDEQSSSDQRNVSERGDAGTGNGESGVPKSGESRCEHRGRGGQRGWRGFRGGGARGFRNRGGIIFFSFFFFLKLELSGLSWKCVECVVVIQTFLIHFRLL